jgi:hypothetical protein
MVEVLTYMVASVGAVFVIGCIVLVYNIHRAEKQRSDV